MGKHYHYLFQKNNLIEKIEIADLWTPSIIWDSFNSLMHVTNSDV